MNFRGHLNGSIIAGFGIVIFAVITGYVKLSEYSITQFINSPFGNGDIQTLVRLFVLCWFMGLFPDLDTASIPRRYFFRGLFVLLLFLYFTKNFDLFAFVSIVSLTPLLHKHRGWTHWKITPWLLVFFMAIVYEYYRTKNTIFLDFSMKQVWVYLYTNWMYVAACVTGHYTHLLLDSQYIKKFSFTVKKFK